VSYNTSPTAPEEPTWGGYEFKGWYLSTAAESTASKENFAAVTENVTYLAKWTAKPYTITYAEEYQYKAGVTAPTTYTIKTTDDLPQPKKDGYTFSKWVATTVPSSDTNLTQGEELTTLNGKYGDVTLTAVFTIDAKGVFTDFAYAHSGYAMLIVSAVPGSGNTVYYDNAQMYYVDSTKSSTYESKLTEKMEGASGVYVTLVEYTDIRELTSVDLTKLKIDTGTDITLNYTGEMDDNSKVNYNDAVIVSEMVMNGADVWSTDATAGLDIQHRLEADMNQDLQKSAADVSAIVAKYYTAPSNAN
jgi:uncharacterized repeat protein (TIGR02543 family)